jgi:nucleoid DNA-binding protein
MTGAIHADLTDLKAQVTALANLLEGLTPGNLESNTPRGLSLLAWHIVTDIDGIQRELEALADSPSRRPAVDKFTRERMTAILRSGVSLDFRQARELAGRLIEALAAALAAGEAVELRGLGSRKSGNAENTGGKTRRPGKR